MRVQKGGGPVKNIQLFGSITTCIRWLGRSGDYKVTSPDLPERGLRESSTPSLHEVSTLTPRESSMKKRRKGTFSTHDGRKRGKRGRGTRARARIVKVGDMFLTSERKCNKDLGMQGRREGSRGTLLGRLLLNVEREGSLAAPQKGTWKGKAIC